MLRSDDEFEVLDSSQSDTEQDILKSRQDKITTLKAKLTNRQRRDVAETLKIQSYIKKKFKNEDQYITTEQKSNRFVLYEGVALQDKTPQEITRNIKELLPSHSVGAITALVPIGLCRPYLGFIPRRVNHQTFLEIHKNAEGNISITHHDSKGWLATIMYALRIYSLNPIERAVREAFTDQTVTFNDRESGNQGFFNKIARAVRNAFGTENLVTFNHLESGNQGILNNVDCVRYTAAAIEQIINNTDRRPGHPIDNINEAKIQEVEQEFIQNDINELEGQIKSFKKDVGAKLNNDKEQLEKKYRDREKDIINDKYKNLLNNQSILNIEKSKKQH